MMMEATADTICPLRALSTTHSLVYRSCSTDRIRKAAFFGDILIVCFDRLEGGG